MNDSSSASQISPAAGVSNLQLQSRSLITFEDIDATWNFWLGVVASAFLILLAAVALIGLTLVRNYLRRRNRTLSDDTGIFAPRRGSKAGLDMIDHNVTVILTQHRTLETEEAPECEDNSERKRLRASSYEM